MALEVNIQRNKDVSLWREYKDEEGNVLAEFKIRGIGYKPYQVALERANNQITAKGFDVAKASPDDKLFHELLLEAVACHLIEDWKGVVFVEEGPNGEQLKSEPAYNAENATKLLNMGDLGVSLWSFILNQKRSKRKQTSIEMMLWESHNPLQLRQQVREAHGPRKKAKRSPWCKAS